MAEINEIISKKAIDGIINTDNAINTLDNSTKRFIESIEMLNTSLKKNKDNTEKIKTAEKANTETKDKLTKLQKEQIAAEKALEKQRTRGLAQMAKLEQKERDLQTAINKEVKSEQDLINKTNALVAVRKRLDVTTEAGRKEHIRLTEEINKNTIALKKQDAAIGRSQRNVGNYGSALKGVGTQLMGALGITAGIYGAIRALKSIISTSRDFEKATATLAGVLDVEIGQTKALTEQAIKLGGEYPTLASEVLNLQTAYARLGFTQKEILNLTEPTIQGSFALNAELGQTAELVGAVVKSYDELGSSDAQTIIDQLTKSTQKSSLNFEALSTALPKVAGAANALNIPLNVTLANLGTAIDATQDASIAGTSYRKILLSNAKAQRSLADGLDIINSSTNKVATAQELYGDRAAVVALALANQTDKTKILADEINNSLGVASRTAEKQMNTLAGAADGVSSSWERFTLTMNKSNGALADFLRTVSNAIDTASDLESLDASIQGGAFFLRLFGVGDKEIEESKKAIKQFYDRARAQTLDELNESYRIQAALVTRLRSEGDEEEFKAQQRRLSFIGKLIGEKTTLQLNAEKEKQAKLKKLLEEEAAEEKKKAEESAAIEKKKQDEINKIKKDRLNDLEIKSIEKKNIDDKILSNEAEIVAEENHQNKLLELELKRIAKEKAAEIEAAALKKQLNQELLDAAAQAVNIGFDFYSSGLEREWNALQEQKENELALNEGNKEEQDKINAKFAAKEAEIKTKQAKADKLQAMFNAANATGVSIIASAQLGFPAAIPFIALAAALGAVQLAAIAARPIPKFYKGTDSAPAGALIAGDRGRELIEHNGSMLMANKPTILSGIEGAKIYTNKETEAIMQGGAGYDSPDLRGVIESNKEIAKAIASQPIYKFETSKRRIIEHRGNYKKTYLNKKVGI